MKKITKKISALGLSIFLMGGLFVINTNTMAQKTDDHTTTQVSAIDPPGH